MSMAGELFSALIDSLNRSERKQVRDDAALEMILLAVSATQTYSAALGRGEGPNRTTEAQLAEKWVRAAVAIRRTDPTLAQRLQLKAEYWTNPQSWGERDIAENGIRLRQIAELARTMLRV